MAVVAAVGWQARAGRREATVGAGMVEVVEVTQVGSAKEEAVMAAVRLGAGVQEVGKGVLREAAKVAVREVDWGAVKAEAAREVGGWEAGREAVAMGMEALVAVVTVEVARAAGLAAVAKVRAAAETAAAVRGEVARVADAECESRRMSSA